MIKISPDKKVFITSDTHFAHKNICRGVTSWSLPDGSIPTDQTRDFKTIEQLNESMPDKTIRVGVCRCMISEHNTREGQAKVARHFIQQTTQ
jgi:hypothetical protein